MFRRHIHSWLPQSPGGVLWYPEADPWPEYQTPAGVGVEEPPDEPPANQPPQQPPANAGPPQPNDRQPQDQPPPGQQPQGGRRDLPQYRSDQIADRDRRAQEEARINELVQAGVRKVLGDALGLSGAPAEDPRSARLRETIFSLIPGLKGLVEKQKELLGVVENAPRMSETNRAYWQGVAARTMTTLYNSMATALLGTGKMAKDLDAETLDDVQDSFVRWCEADRTGARVARYESQDPELVSEYVKAFTTRYLDPVRRNAAVDVTQRGRDRQQQPVQGPAGQPPAAQPPAVDNQNEDAVHGRGWAVVQQLRQAAGR